MLLSNQTDLLDRKFGSEAEAIRQIGLAGFDAVDLSCFDMCSPDSPKRTSARVEYARTLAEAARSAGVIFRQAHAPFPSSRGEEEADKAILDSITDCLYFCSLLHIPVVVVHPKQHLPYYENKEKLKQLNLDFYRSLQPFAEKYGLRIALENMWKTDRRGTIRDSVCASPEEFCEYMDSLDSRYFTACLDVGHAWLCGRTAGLLARRLGHERLHALHVHNTDLLCDLHTIPFSNIAQDWSEFTSALKEIQYDGDMTFEANNFFLPYPTEFLPTALRFLHDTGRLLIRMAE